MHTPEPYPLSLHDALPIFLEPDVVGIGGEADGRSDVGIDADAEQHRAGVVEVRLALLLRAAQVVEDRDRKSTRLNSSHLVISYAVFCLKKKNINRIAMMLL